MKDSYDFTFVSMTSPCSVKIYEGDYNNALRCFEEIKKNTLFLERKYNFYNKASYISQNINKRSRNKIKVDSQTAHILKDVRELSILTNNIFDITVGTLKEAYKKKTLDVD